MNDVFNLDLAELADPEAVQNQHDIAPIKVGLNEELAGLPNSVWRLASREEGLGEYSDDLVMLERVPREGDKVLAADGVENGLGVTVVALFDEPAEELRKRNMIAVLKASRRQPLEVVPAMLLGIRISRGERNTVFAGNLVPVGNIRKHAI